MAGLRLLLALGSNTGDRLGFLSQAVQRLGEGENAVFTNGCEHSAIYESHALLPENAPADWNTDFLNMAVVGDCALLPRDILTRVKSIEQALGRVTRGVWGPRKIDIDIIALGAVVHDEPDLKIPHIHACSRDFVLLPLADIAPDWPIDKTHTVSELIARQNMQLGNQLRRTDYKLAVA